MPLINKPDPMLQENLMAFGRECDSGWDKIIDELIERLNELPEVMYLMQIKEKFGTLRFYISNETEVASSIIEEYEIYSGHICEVCGEFYTSKNRDIGGHWYKTLCEDCYSKLALDK